MPNATITPAGIVFQQGIFPVVLGPTPRSLYVHENDGIQTNVVAGAGSDARSLYVVESDTFWATSVLARSQYVVESDVIWALSVLLRDMYTYEATKDLPVVPWLNSIDPNQQYPLGTVDLYGDGLGQFAEVAAGSTITASSTAGTDIPANVVARSATLGWNSNDTTTAWIRFTFGAPTPVSMIAIEGALSGSTWGIPLFRFSDGGADVIGAAAVPTPDAFHRDSEYPVGPQRYLYTLPSIRTVTWVEVRVSSGGSGNRGLSQVWVYADEGQNAETSAALLNALSMGAVTWTNRSPGLWPANGGTPLSPAATVTVPALGTSGLVKVEES